MAKANHVKSAQKNIYKIGNTREYVSKKGKREGQTKSVTDKTIPADEGDEIFIAKGESYYWWQFKNSPKKYSKERPKQSQLTQSNFLSQLYAIEEKIEEFSCDNREDFESFRDEVKDEIEALKDECDESLNNMPEGLQSSPNGELLQERIDAMESWASDIESVECDYDEEDLRQEVRDEKDDDEELTDDEIEEKVNEKIQEKVDEAIDELKGVSHGL